MTGLIIILVIIAIAIAIISRGLRIVPQQHAWIVERLGRYNTTLGPGLNLIVPLVDKVAYRFDLREHPIEVKEQVCITKDNTPITISGVLYVQFTDAKSAAYGTTNPLTSVEQLAQTIMRSQVGQMVLDEVFSERAKLNGEIVSELDKAAVNWGIKVLRYEIKDITPPRSIQDAMEKQITAERTKRATILTSEADRQKAINVSEGQRQEQINLAEGEKQSQILRAEGQAGAIRAVADATAVALQTVGKALADENGKNAMQMRVAEDYIAAFANIAKQANTMVVPSNLGDMAGTVATALGIVRTVQPK
ncbi:MAG: SPFH domain-containing protein [Rhodanobacteraceae bacterium]